MARLGRRLSVSWDQTRVSQTMNVLWAGGTGLHQSSFKSSDIFFAVLDPRFPHSCWLPCRNRSLRLPSFLLKPPCVHFLQQYTEFAYTSIPLILTGIYFCLGQKKNVLCLLGFIWQDWSHWKKVKVVSEFETFIPIAMSAKTLLPFRPAKYS